MSKAIESLKCLYNEAVYTWDDNLIRKEGPGHTREVAEHDSVHDGRTAALAFAAGRFTGSMGQTDGIEVLKEISRLQIKEPKDTFYGCFRWYREETKVNDTNAAFFTLEPFVVTMLFHPEILTEDEKKLINDMLAISTNWFIRECSDPILFYTNKIISDGAMLAAIGCLTNDDKVYEIALEFLKKWMNYTETRGYGWGENLSLGYNSVILRAFNVIKKSLKKNNESDLLKRFSTQEQAILDIFRFHDGHEFVPTIRSYNITGETKPWSLVFNLAGVRGYGIADGNQESFGSGKNDAIYRLITDYMIYGERLYINDEDYMGRGISNNQAVPRIGEFRIMDDRKSYTWIGKNGGIGSINEFPVIEGSYQHKTWGLGWQCFPAGIIVYDNQVSFLRFYVDDGTRIRCHPHKDKHRAFLDPALFSESYYPKVRTACRQSGQTLIVFRSINNMRNRVSLIADSFDVTGFSGRWAKFNENGRSFTALFFESACIIATALLGNPVSDESSLKDERGNVIPTVTMDIELVEDNEGLRLVQNMYSGKLQSLFNDRLSVGWFFHYFDKSMTDDEVRKFICELSIEEACIPDGDIPRMHEWNIHEVHICHEGNKLLDVRYDPYE